MLYITGDLHGYDRKWVEQIHPVLRAGDMLFVAGDFGIGLFRGELLSEETFYDWIEQQTYTVLVVDGNHENFDQLAAYPVQDWCGGKVHRIRENLLHLMRGEVYTIAGKTFFVMGGGYSLDKAFREEGVDWWPQELPSTAEYDNAVAHLKQCDGYVDYIITHTCPAETVLYLASLDPYTIRKDVVEEMQLTSFLDYVHFKTRYQRYYFGHFHMDAELWRGQTVLFNCVRELESGKVVRSWDTYEGF